MPKKTPLLTKIQRRELIRKAHSLKPELHVGKDGLSKTFLKSLREAFNTKELLKIKLLDNSPEDRASLTAKLEKLGDVQLVSNIGLTYILFKPLEEEEKPKRPVSKAAAEAKRKKAAPKLADKPAPHRERERPPWENDDLNSGSGEDYVVDYGGDFDEDFEDGFEELTGETPAPQPPAGKPAKKTVKKAAKKSSKRIAKKPGKKAIRKFNSRAGRRGAARNKRKD